MSSGEGLSSIGLFPPHKTWGFSPGADTTLIEVVTTPSGSTETKEYTFNIPAPQALELMLEAVTSAQALGMRKVSVVTTPERVRVELASVSGSWRVYTLEA